MLHVYVDADACPVKAEVARVAARHGIEVTLVANSSIPAPRQPGMRVEVVSGAFDAADDWIATHAEADDIVVTGDIPLAARCIARHAAVVTPTGRRYTEDNIGDALATREVLADARAYGVTVGPPPFGKKDRSRFLQSLDETVQSIRRRSGR
jgi:uncharacterized protein YaiI (UPF0178 family)